MHPSKFLAVTCSPGKQQFKGTLIKVPSCWEHFVCLELKCQSLCRCCVCQTNACQSQRDTIMILPGSRTRIARNDTALVSQVASFCTSRFCLILDFFGGFATGALVFTFLVLRRMCLVCVESIRLIAAAGAATVYEVCTDVYSRQRGFLRDAQAECSNRKTCVPIEITLLPLSTYGLFLVAT